MQKKIWVLAGLVLIMFIVFGGYDPQPNKLKTKLVADLGSVTLPPAGTSSTAVTTTAFTAPSSSTTDATTTTESSSAADSTSTAPACAIDLNGITAAIIAAINAATGATAVTATTTSATTTSTVATTVTSSVYQYRYLTNVDECTLNRYGAQGWSIPQMGSVATDNIGGPYYAADCRTQTRAFVDWAFLVKQPPQ